MHSLPATFQQNKNINKENLLVVAHVLHLYYTRVETNRKLNYIILFVYLGIQKRSQLLFATELGFTLNNFFQITCAPSTVYSEIKSLKTFCWWHNNIQRHGDSRTRATRHLLYRTTTKASTRICVLHNLYMMAERQ